MNVRTVEQMKMHAVQEYANEKRECCGFVIAVGRNEIYFPCENKAAKNAATGEWDSFEISAEDYMRAEETGSIIAIFHSHPDKSAQPSEADLVSCEQHQVPWIIASVMEGEVVHMHRIEPSGYVAPLIGRSFYYNVLDCFTVIQDFFSREYGIHIERFPSEDGWWEGDEEIYLNNFKDAGFEVVKEGEPLQRGDVIFMQVRSKRTNHAGVFLGNSALKEAPDLFPVPDAMIHHFRGRLSERVPYQGWYRDITRMIVRHKDLK